MKQLILACLLTVGLFSCTNYGKKVSKDYLEVYYKDGATETEAQKTVDFLYPLWKEDGSTAKKSVQLTKSGDTINFRMVVDQAKLAKMEDLTFQLMSNLFSDSIYSGAPVNMVFTDDSFKPIRTLAFKKMDMKDDFGEKITAGPIEVYVKDGFSMEEAQNLASFLEKEMSAGANVTSFQVGKTDDGGYLVRMVSQEAKAAELGDAAFKNLAEVLSKNVFNGGQVTFELTDGRFNPYKKFVSAFQQSPDTISVSQ